MKIDKEIVREYDIRGIYNLNLTDDVAKLVGYALARYIINKSLIGKIAVCYDGRHSSPKLAENLIKGISNQGVDVVNLGVGPTPMLYYSNFIDSEVVAGVMITGSHNPPEYNGFKFIVNKKPFYGQELKNLFSQDFYNTDCARAGEIISKDLSKKYVEFLRSELLENKNLKVIWDCGNGATGDVIQDLCGLLPGEHIVLNGKIDGNFPSHHPDPTEEKNLLEIIDKVKSTKADFGIAFDGDGDRIGIVDGNGKIIWGDQILAILAQDLLKKIPGAKIIADVKSSKILFDIIKSSGGEGIIWKTGHSNIKTKMIELSSPLAGEMSGHIFYKDRYYGYDDAIYAAIRFINCFTKNNDCIDEIIKAFSKVTSTPEIRIQCDEDKKFSVVESIKNHLIEEGVDFNDTDGVRVDNHDGWWLIRASNTQDILVLRVEGLSYEGFHNLKNECELVLKKFGFNFPGEF